MNLFGEYLVEKQLIKEEQLLEALIKQAEEQPPVAKVVRDLGILDQAEILKCIKEQTLTFCSFVDAAKKRGVWKEEFSERLTSDLAGKRTPLGEMLVRANCLDLSALTKALDEFFGDRQRKGSDKAQESTTDSKITSPTVHASLPFPEVFEFLGEQFFIHLQNAIQSVSKDKIFDLAPITAFTEELHKIVGAARLYGFAEMSDFAERIEITLRDMGTRKVAKIGDDITKKLFKALSEANEVFSASVKEHSTGSLKAEFITKSEIAPLAKSVMDYFMLIEFDLSSVDQEISK